MSKFFKTESGKKLYNSIPTVEFKENYLGSTGYIDGLSPSDSAFDDSSVVKFTDPHGRDAIGIKYNTDCGNFHGTFAVTVFERYAEEKSPIYFGGHYAHGLIIEYPLGYKSDEIENLIGTGRGEVKGCVLELFTPHVVAQEVTNEVETVGEVQLSSDL